MKNRAVIAAVSLCLAALLAVNAGAESFSGASGWSVAFTRDEEMESNFSSSELTDAVSGLQPGDDIVFSIKIENQSEELTNWYMNNRVLYSLEDRSANAGTSGGAYSYELVYTDSSGEKLVLFSSDTVGGEGKTPAGEGLHSTTDALKDFFFLDALDTGDAGSITLRVALEGETQGNDYQDTLADMSMSFAVEIDNFSGGADGDHTGTPKPGSRTVTVETGDTTNIQPYYWIMAGSGALFLLLAIYSVYLRRKDKRSEGDDRG